MNLIEKQLETQLKFNGFIINVHHDRVSLNDGEILTYREVVEHPGGVCIAAQLENGKYLMVEQFRYAQKEVTLEFVAGKKEQLMSDEVNVLRELEEETGYIAQEITFVGEVYPSPAYLTERISLYTGSDLIKSKQSLDFGEYLNVVELSLDEIMDKIKTNEIRDLKTIALAYHLYK